MVVFTKPREKELIMGELKYRLGNQPEEYALKEDYLGWIPKDDNWMRLCVEGIRNTKLIIVNLADGNYEELFLHHFIIKDAFPLSFFGEKRSENWTRFAIVSFNETSEKFIIPLH